MTNSRLGTRRPQPFGTPRRPKQAEIHTSIGEIFCDIGRLAETLRQFQEAIANRD
jgi:hypothetical protein